MKDVAARVATLYDGTRLYAAASLTPRSWALPLAASLSRLTLPRGWLLRVSFFCVLLTIIYDPRGGWEPSWPTK